MASNPPPILHHLTDSQSIRVLFALEELSYELNQPYTLKVYNRVKGRAPPALKDVFSLGKSPTLEIPPIVSSAQPERRHIIAGPNPTTETTIITESRFILDYLAKNYANDLWNPSPEDEVRDVFFQDFAMATLGPLTERILIFDLIKQATPLLVRPVAWIMFHPFVWMFKKDLDGPLSLMENSLSNVNLFFAGRKIGIADFCLIWPMDLAEKRGWFDGNKYPRLMAWLGRVRRREAYQRAVAKSGGHELKTFGL